MTKSEAKKEAWMLILGVSSRAFNLGEFDDVLKQMTVSMTGKPITVRDREKISDSLEDCIEILENKIE